MGTLELTMEVKLRVDDDAVLRRSRMMGIDSPHHAALWMKTLEEGHRLNSLTTVALVDLGTRTPVLDKAHETPQVAV